MVLFLLIDLFILYSPRYIGGLGHLYKTYYSKWGVSSCRFIVCSSLYWLSEVEVNWPVSLDISACYVWSSVYKWSSLGPGSVWCSSLLDGIGPLPLCSWLTHFFNCCWRRCRLKNKLILPLMLYTLWLYGQEWYYFFNFFRRHLNSSKYFAVVVSNCFIIFNN